MARTVTDRVKGSSLIRRGSAAVELAIAVPVVVLLAIGVFDLGRILVAAVTVANAARAGAVYGTLEPGNATDTAAINQAARDDGLDLGTLAVTSRSYCRCDAGEVGDCLTGDCGVYGAYRVYVEVTAVKKIGLLFKYPGMPDTVTVTKVATLRGQ
jgi:Flp pilus assembly protein TadG